MPITDYYVASDAMGSITAILDDEGNVLERRTYDAFGKMTCMAPDGTPVMESPTGVDVGFQGQICDAATGLYQMGYRWYSPTLGHWLSQDPIGLEAGANLMIFGGNNPPVNNDYFGLQYVDTISHGATGYGPPNTSLQNTNLLDLLVLTHRISRVAAATRMIECDYMHRRYDNYKCDKCGFLTSKEEACERAKCFAQEIALRNKFVEMRCDFYLYNSIASIGGSEAKLAGHLVQIDDKTKALIKCSNACCK